MPNRTVKTADLAGQDLNQVIHSILHPDSTTTPNDLGAPGCADFAALIDHEGILCGPSPFPGSAYAAGIGSSWDDAVHIQTGATRAQSVLRCFVASRMGLEVTLLEMTTATEAETDRKVVGMADPKEQEIFAKFQKWFGESTVVKNGSPRSVFHGTTEDFTRFDISDGVELRGAFFSEDADEAKEWANLHDGPNARVVEAYLRIERPADYGDIQEIITRFKKHGHEIPTPKQVTDALKRAGFDGYIDDRGGYDEYVVFSPSQVVLAAQTPIEVRNSISVAAENTQLESLLINGYPIPLKDGYWISLGGNGSGYWITKYQDNSGLEVGSSQGNVYPKDEAQNCLEVNAKRIDFERQALLSSGREALPSWCALAYKAPSPADSPSP